MNMNKRSDVMKGVRKSGASHRGSCCRRHPPVPTPKKPLKKIHHPPPPTKLPDIKRPSRPRIIWPIAPDGVIPNSVLRSRAPFPPRSGATARERKTETREEDRDFLAESVRYIDGLIKKYEKIALADEEGAKKQPSCSFAKNVRQIFKTDKL